MRRFWLLFAQTVTVGLACWFILASLKPQWAGALLDGRNGLGSAPAPTAIQAPPSASPAQASYREAASRAMPAVVNIFTSKSARQQQHPLMDDPLFRRFFGDPQEDQLTCVWKPMGVSA